MTGTMIARIGGLAALLFAFAAPAQETAPDALVKNLVNEVIQVIAQNKDPKVLAEVAEKKVVAHFDFKRMTQLAVGRGWSEANSAQQQKLEAAFRTLLVRTYATALAQTSGKTRVDVKPASVGAGDKETVVRTVVNEPGRKPFGIDYRMAKAADGWKVYDVVVENLSLVTNYRGSFQSEVSRGGIDGLIKAIETKNQGQKQEG
jgi:phospholipid transport system substrate-binding protein